MLMLPPGESGLSPDPSMSTSMSPESVTLVWYTGSGAGPLPTLPTSGRSGRLGHHSPTCSPLSSLNWDPCAGHTMQPSSVNLALNSAVFPCMDKFRCGHLFDTA